MGNYPHVLHNVHRRAQRERCGDVEHVMDPVRLILGRVCGKCHAGSYGDHEPANQSSLCSHGTHSIVQIIDFLLPDYEELLDRAVFKRSISRVGFLRYENDGISKCGEGGLSILVLVYLSVNFVVLGSIVYLGFRLRVA